MQSFQQDGKQLLWVVLLEAHELVCFLRNDSFDVPGCKVSGVANVELRDEVSEGNGELTFGTVDAWLIQMKEVYFKEVVFNKRFCVSYALKNAVHKAGITKVL